MVSEIYEPWAPQPGDLVRVNISPECRVLVHYFGSEDDEDDIEQFGHDMDENGATGYVDYLEPSDPHADPDVNARRAHRVLVQFEPPVIVSMTDYPQSCQYFAVAELEPLTAAPRPTPADGGA